MLKAKAKAFTVKPCGCRHPLCTIVSLEGENGKLTKAEATLAAQAPIMRELLTRAVEFPDDRLDPQLLAEMEALLGKTKV